MYLWMAGRTYIQKPLTSRQREIILKEIMTFQEKFHEPAKLLSSNFINHRVNKVPIFIL